MKIGDEIFDRLEQISACSTPGTGVTRMPFTPEHDQALDLLRDWMEQAGLEVSLDDAGTLVGRKTGSDPARTLLIGSHQDSIPNGGKYDGILGIVLPIVCLERLREERLPFSVEILAFADEEGVRFPTALVGSRSLAGSFDPAVLSLCDDRGMPLRDAIKSYNLDPENIVNLKRDADKVTGFLEVHIEQGPVLESKDLPVGIVTSICGIERWQVRLEGRAAHAGTTPMHLRRDALAGAAEIVSEVERYCRERDELVGVVGSLNVEPNAVNVIPAVTRFSIELRSGSDHLRETAGRDIAGIVEEMATRRGLLLEIDKTYTQMAAQCDPGLSDSLENAVTDAVVPAFRLMSGATHDASAMADLCPIAMLFVRCREGISHHHEEAITAEDAGIAADILIRFLRTLT